MTGPQAVASYAEVRAWATERGLPAAKLIAAATLDAWDDAHPDRPSLRPHARADRSHPIEGCPLTRAQLDIVRHAADGLTNAEIGARLFIAAETVKTHLARALEALGAANRAQAVATCLRRKWID